eukprot:761030-Hanusia_phi.AAC.4
MINLTSSQEASNHGFNNRAPYRVQPESVGEDMENLSTVGSSGLGPERNFLLGKKAGDNSETVPPSLDPFLRDEDVGSDASESAADSSKSDDESLLHEERTSSQEETVVSSDFTFRPKAFKRRSKRLDVQENHEIDGMLDSGMTERVPQHLLPPDPRMWKRKSRNRFENDMDMGQSLGGIQAEFDDLDIRRQTHQDAPESQSEKEEFRAEQPREDVLYHDERVVELRKYVRKQFKRDEITIYRKIGNRIVEDDFEFYRLTSREREIREFKAAQKRVVGSVSSSVEDFEFVSRDGENFSSPHAFIDHRA